MPGDWWTETEFILGTSYQRGIHHQGHFFEYENFFEIVQAKFTVNIVTIINPSLLIASTSCANILMKRLCSRDQEETTRKSDNKIRRQQQFYNNNKKKKNSADESEPSA